NWPAPRSRSCSRPERPTSRRSRFATPCACSSLRQLRSSARRVRASCASDNIPPPLAIFDRAIVRMLPAVPRPVVQKLSERYIAGPELKDAREAVRRLNAEGKMATIDVLGEEITNEEEAAAIVRAYQDVFADIERCGLDSNVSVKVQALEALLEAGCYVGIATHDDVLLRKGRKLVLEHELAREEYEFQMLLGVRAGLGNQLVREGHRLRIYVPFGRHWYAYSLRRLQENPKIAGYIAADTFGRLIGRRNGDEALRRLAR